MAEHTRLKDHWFHILLALAERELHGTAIMEEVLERTSGQLRLWPGKLYGALKELTDAGFMGMTVPKELGGPGLGFLEVALVIEEVSRACGATGRIVTEANMGAIAAILRFGTDEQKKICADLVLAGDKPAICMSEPDAGSAATEMTTTAVKKGDKYIINGQKHWITGGADVSKVHFVLARVEDRFAAEPVVVIGVHSAKFISERDPENIRRAMARYDVRHPVVVAVTREVEVQVLRAGERRSEVEVPHREGEAGAAPDHGGRDPGGRSGGYRVLYG